MLEAHSIGIIHAWVYKPAQKPMAWEITGHRKKPTSIALLNGTVKLLSTYVYIHRSRIL